jgi:YaiO family outer membrane protein
MTLPRCHPLRAAVCAAILLLVTDAAAQSGAFVEVAGDHSFVTTGPVETSWRMARVAGGVQVDGRFGWVVAAERHERSGVVDWTGEVRGFRRQAPWTFVGAAAAGPDTRFYYRRSLEGEVARDLSHGLVLHGGYRHMQFPQASVHVIQPALSWYIGAHDIQARTYLVRNATTNQDALTVLLRGTVQASPRVRLAGGAAIGSRIFDVTSSVATDAEGWVAFGYTQVLVTPHLMLIAGAGGAHEDPVFDQRTLSLAARWIF